MQIFVDVWCLFNSKFIEVIVKLIKYILYYVVQNGSKGLSPKNSIAIPTFGVSGLSSSWVWIKLQINVTTPSHYPHFTL
jgi:hypothetical protein